MALALKPPSQVLGSSVRKAREALKTRANEILDLLIGNAKMASASGDFETAQKAYQFLLEHLPEDDGQRVIDISVDKPKQVEAGPRGPAIQIGIAVAGTGRQLPEPTMINITPLRDPIEVLDLDE